MKLQTGLAPVCLLLVLLLAPTALFSKYLDINIKVDNAILMDAETGQVLFEKNSHQQGFPASITKVATALYIMKRTKGIFPDLSLVADQDSIGAVSSKEKKRSKYSLPAYWLEFGGTHMGIKRGEKLPFDALFYGLMLISGNDAANVLAKFIGGSIPKFMSELHAYLREIGCLNTTFLNPHGLHLPGHKTTAYDMAVIMREALNYDLLVKVMSTERYRRPQTNKQKSVVMAHNIPHLKKRSKHYYPYMIAGKTGYTSDAEHALVAAADNGKRRLVAVVMAGGSSKQRYQSVIKMFDAGFNEEIKSRLLVSKGKQKYTRKIKGANRSLNTYNDQALEIEYYPSQEPSVKASLRWLDVSLPIQKGEAVAELSITLSNGKVEKRTLSAAFPVKATLLHKALTFVKGIGSTAWLVTTVVFVLALFFVGRKRAE